VNIAHIEEQSYIYGPGCRFVIWTQGCTLRCPGCWNHAMWDFDPRSVLSVEEIFRQIRAMGNSVEGVTLLGGEPLDQYEETCRLLSLCRAVDLSTMLFTGYRLAELREKRMTAILPLTDILITGRYEKEKRTLNHQWIGSTNQEIHFLSERYRDYQQKYGNYVEISIDESGALTVLGFPDQDFSRQY